MANPPLLAFLLLSSLSSTASTPNHHDAPLDPPPGPPLSHLSLDYYAKTCPRVTEIINNVVISKQTAFSSTAAAALRIFFHDCTIGGCDASILISSTPSNKAERDDELNESLPGDGFDVINLAKVDLERECPGVVSCADILAVATRDLVVQEGGPWYQVKMGRKDGLRSKISDVAANIPLPNMTMDTLLEMFESQGFNTREMVALVGGGHTIGFAHCKEFESRVFCVRPDPTMHPKLVDRLRELCANRSTDHTMAAFLDPISSGVFDNNIYKNVLKGLGVLGSDEAMAHDPRTRPIVEEYAQNSEVFFQDFARAMEKLSEYKVKTGEEGEVRRMCEAVNNPETSTSI